MSGFANALDDPVPSAPAYAVQGRPVQGTPVQALPVQGVPVGTTSHAVDTPVKGQHGDAILAGFELWIPPIPNQYADGLPVYEILGTDAQIVQIPLRAGRQVMCFSGAMAYMSDGMKMEVKLAGLGKTFGRLAGGGSLFQLTYTNETQQDGYIALTPDYPGVIVPIHMALCPAGKIVAMRDSFLGATVGLGEVTTDVGAG